MDLLLIISLLFFTLSLLTFIVSFVVALYYTIRIRVYYINYQRDSSSFEEGVERVLDSYEKGGTPRKRFEEDFMIPQKGDSENLLELKKGMRLSRRILYLFLGFFVITAIFFVIIGTR